MDKEPAMPGKSIVRILGIAWLFYGALLDANPATGIVFAAFGLLLLLLSELIMDALANDVVISTRYKRRMGWW